MRGRPPKPASLRRLHGNTRRLGRKEQAARSAEGSVYPSTHLSPPEFLTRAAKLEWNRLASLMAKGGQTTALDRPALVSITEQYSLLLLCQDALAEIHQRAAGPVGKEGMGGNALFITGPNGAPYPDPAVKLFLELSRNLRHWYNLFGMTPAARLRDRTQKVPAPEAPAAPASGSLAGFLAARPALQVVPDPVPLKKISPKVNKKGDDENGN